MSYHNDDSAGIGAIIFMAIIVGGILAISFSKCNGGDHKSAEKEFRNWAKALDIKYDAAQCNNHDGDGDGYVSCTYTIDDAINTVECAGSWTMQSGCRTPKMRVQSAH